MKKIKEILEQAGCSLANDTKRIRLQFICIYIILAVVAAGMTIVNIFTHKNTLMIATLAFSILCIINVLLTRSGDKGLKISGSLFCIEIVCLFIFFIVSGIPEGFSAIWVCLLPAGGMLLFMRKRGTLFCAIMFAILIFFFQTSVGQEMLQYPYTESFKLRFPMLYIAFWAVAFFWETIRALTHDKLQSTQRQYEYLYSHDALTDVYNRYGFNQSITHFLHKTSDNPIGILMLDIDFFKNVNDRYGHSGGDKVLQNVAKFLAQKAGASNKVCRWGGEEFVILYENGDYAQQNAYDICDTIHNTPIEFDGREISITVSIGVVIALPDQSLTDDIIIKLADECLYRAKAGGRDRVVCHDLRIPEDDT